MRKSLLALAAVTALAVSTASTAHAWRGGWVPGLAAGLLGGAIIGGANGPGYVGAPVGPCHWQHQRVWDGYGWRVQSVQVRG